MTEAELRAQTEEQFGKEPGFVPAEQFYAEHRKRHGEE